jgi:hypothetical protein
VITIRHTHEDGTLIEGTVKGDGVYEITKRYGFRWFPSIRAIGIRGSRDQVAKRWKINGAAEALRAAGHEVTVEIDDTPRGRAEVLADQSERLDDRAEALAAKAAKHQAESDAAFTRASQIGERFAFGQPILVGHHSERSARADQRRIQAAMDRSRTEFETAEDAARRAAAVGRNADYSARPGVTARRVERAEAELRKIQRSLDGYTTRHYMGDGKTIAYQFDHEPATGEHRESLLARKAQLEDQLAYDRAQLAAAQEAGQHVAYGPHNVHVGDLVHHGYGWYRVVKVNKVTVSVETGYTWHDKIRFTDIRRHRPAGAEPDHPRPEADRRPAAPPPPDTPTLTWAGDANPQLRDQLTVPQARSEDGCFFTPPAVAKWVVDELTGVADLPAGARVLEPSAGGGSLVRAVLTANPQVQVAAVEPNRDLTTVLMRSTAGLPGEVTVYRVPFEVWASADRGLFDAVVMNPPFTLPGQPTVWIDHVTLAWQLVKPGGRLVAIVPAGFAFRDDARHCAVRALVDEHGDWQHLPEGAFTTSGTGVRTCVIHLDKTTTPAEPAPVPAPPPEAAPAPAQWDQPELFTEGASR